MVLESFGVGNMPDLPAQGWLPWLKTNIKQGVKVCAPPKLSVCQRASRTQCSGRPRHAEQRVA